MNEKNFLARYYDKILFGLAIALLATSVVVFLTTSSDASDAGYVSRMKALKPSADAVSATDMSNFSATERLVKKPFAIGSVNTKTSNFLASARRVLCASDKCKKPIPADADVCPFCGFKQPKEVIVNIDTDNDGIPNDVEIKYGLNPNDPSDADKDIDSDGFTNLEEYLAKTDMNDPLSHPDYLDYLSLESIKGRVLPFYILGVNTLPDGKKQFNVYVVSERRSYYIKEGGQIAIKKGAQKPELFVPVAYNNKIEEREDKRLGNIKRRFDVSTITVLRVADKKTFTVKINEKNKETDLCAVLSYSRDGGKKYNVVENETFAIRKNKYFVKEVLKDKNVVIVEDVKTKKQKMIQKLD